MTIDRNRAAGDEVFVTFPGASADEGNQLASTLAEALRDIDRRISVERLREQAQTQDFGATLAVIVGTTAASALAKGIAAWLARNSGAQIEVRRKGEVILVASHLDSKDVPKIAAALSAKN